MIRCNNCGTNNIDGSEYCDECGAHLNLAPLPRPRGQQPVEAPVFHPPSAVPSEPVSPETIDAPPLLPPSFTTSTSIPKPALPVREQRQSDARGQDSSDSGHRVLSRKREDSSPSSPRHAARHNAVERRAIEAPRPEDTLPPEPQNTYALASRANTDPMESDRPDADISQVQRIAARLVIERGGRIGKEFPITGIETNIGRWDADSGIFPDVDLDEDDPEAKISRRHARIVNHQGQYYIEDLGSTNGTFINRGRRLLPGKRHVLQNGDEVIVGKTFLKFQVMR